MSEAQPDTDQPVPAKQDPVNDPYKRYGHDFPKPGVNGPINGPKGPAPRSA